MKTFLIHVGSAQEAIKKKGYFKSFEDHSEDYSKKRGKVKELKNQLVALKEALAAQPKDPKETTVEAANESSAALCAETKADLKIALEAVAEAVTQRDKAAADMFQLYANLLSVNARYAWNKIVLRPTPTRISKGLPERGPGESHASLSRTVSCSTFSPCFPTTRQSRRGTTSRTC